MIIFDSQILPTIFMYAKTSFTKVGLDLFVLCVKKTFISEANKNTWLKVSVRFQQSFSRIGIARRFRLCSRLIENVACAGGDAQGGL